MQASYSNLMGTQALPLSGLWSAAVNESCRCKQRYRPIKFSRLSLPFSAKS